MSINVACVCGAEFVAPQRMSGKTGRCSSCGRALLIYDATEAKARGEAIDADWIRVHCKACGKRIKAPLDWAGKEGNCPRCQQEVEIPWPDPPGAAVEEWGSAPAASDPRADPTPAFDLPPVLDQPSSLPPPDQPESPPPPEAAADTAKVDALVKHAMKEFGQPDLDSDSGLAAEDHGEKGDLDAMSTDFDDEASGLAEMFAEAPPKEPTDPLSEGKLYAPTLERAEERRRRAMARLRRTRPWWRFWS